MMVAVDHGDCGCLTVVCLFAWNIGRGVQHSTATSDHGLKMEERDLLPSRNYGASVPVPEEQTLAPRHLHAALR